MVSEVAEVEVSEQLDLSYAHCSIAQEWYIVARLVFCSAANHPAHIEVA